MFTTSAMSLLHKDIGLQTSGIDPSRDPTTSSSSLQNVAASFQERTVQLAREQSLLEQTQQSLENLENIEKQQNRQFASYRLEFIHARQERDAAEGDALALQEKSAALREEIQFVLEEIKDFKSGARNRIEVHQSKNEEMLIIPHRAGCQLYMDYLHARINAIEQSEHQREVKRKKLIEAIAHLREKCGEVEQRKQVVDQQIRDKNEAMICESADGQQIATKVRAALEQRKQLRHDLRRAKNQL